MTYNGTKLGQDSRFKNPDKDILSSMKIPKIYKTTVSKNNLTILPIIKLWLNKRINDILEFEDETLANLIINLIKSSSEKIDPKNIQYQISGFLGENTYNFMKQFWKLLINVQELYIKDQISIPEELIPFKEEYEKRKQFYKSNKIKFEKSQKDFDDLNNNINYNEIINIDEKPKEENKKYKDDDSYIEKYSKENYRNKEDEKYYYKRSKSRSRSIDNYRYKSKEKYKSRSKSRTRSRNRRNIKYEKEKYRNISRSRSTEKRYNYSRSRSRSRNRRSRYRSRSRNRYRSRSRKNDRKEKRYREDYKYKRSKEKRREYSEDYDSYYSKSYDSRKYRKKKIEYDEDYKKSPSKSSDSSSETLKIEQNSLFSDSKSSETNQNIKSSKYNYKI